MRNGHRPVCVARCGHRRLHLKNSVSKVGFDRGLCPFLASNRGRLPIEPTNNMDNGHRLRSIASISSAERLRCAKESECAIPASLVLISWFVSRKGICWRNKQEVYYARPRSIVSIWPLQRCRVLCKRVCVNIYLPFSLFLTRHAFFELWRTS